MLTTTVLKALLLLYILHHNLQALGGFAVFWLNCVKAVRMGTTHNAESSKPGHYTWNIGI